MTLPLTINLLSLLLYLVAGGYGLFLVKQRKNLNQKPLLALTMGAIGLHLLGVYSLIVLPEGIDVGLYKMSSLIVLSINIILFISSLRKPLHNLLIMIFPFSIICIAASLLFKQPPQFISVDPGVTAHILLSIVAYSLIAIASLQALFWSWQNHQLKSNNLTGIVKLLPPLQTMEQLMFELLWAGVISLTLGIVAGMFYIDNIFSQHLVHKTVLSLFAWLIFAGLLAGSLTLGWRGNTAVKWILSGFCLLMLAYFGSKAVLELILK